MQTSPENRSEMPSEVNDLLARIPVFAGADDICVEPLQDVISLNNTNYRVMANGREYVLRMAAETAQLLGVRRDEEGEAEQKVLLMAYGYTEPLDLQSLHAMQ